MVAARKRRMSFNTRRSVIISFVIVMFMGHMIEAWAEPPLPAYEDKHLGIVFPREFAGLIFDGQTKYEQAALGYCLRYGGRDLLKADIYVYDGGIPNIPNGHDNETVKSEAGYAAQALEILQERGQYTGLFRLETGVVPQQGNIKFLWDKFQYAQAPGKNVLYTGIRVSETFLTGFHGKFLKIRLTYKEINLKEGMKTSDELIKVLTEIMMNAKPSAGKLGSEMR